MVVAGNLAFYWQIKGALYVTVPEIFLFGKLWVLSVELSEPFNRPRAAHAEITKIIAYRLHNLGHTHASYDVFGDGGTVGDWSANWKDGGKKESTNESKNSALA